MVKNVPSFFFFGLRSENHCCFFQPGSPPSRAYEAPTPGSGWASTPGGNYSDAGTPRDSSSTYGNLFVLTLIIEPCISFLLPFSPPLPSCNQT